MSRFNQRKASSASVLVHRYPVCFSCECLVQYKRIAAAYPATSPEEGKWLNLPKIRARAAKRKGGDAVLKSLLGPVPDNAAIAKVPRPPHPVDHGRARFRRRLRVAGDRAEMAGLRGGLPRLRAEAAAVPARRFLARARLGQPHRAQPAKDQVGARQCGLRRARVEGARQFRQVPGRLAGRRPGRADGLSRQTWQPARRQYRSISVALAGLGHASSCRTTWCWG